MPYRAERGEPADAKSIVGIAKQLQAIESTPRGFQRHVDFAGRRCKYLPEFVEKELVAEFGVSARDAATIVRLAKQLSDLENDLTNFNAVDPMIGYA